MAEIKYPCPMCGKELIPTNGRRSVSTIRCRTGGCGFEEGAVNFINRLAKQLTQAQARIEELEGKLDKTADGVVITPESELWQIDSKFGCIHGGRPWHCGKGWGFQRVSGEPVYSTEEEALKHQYISATRAAAEAAESSASGAAQIAPCGDHVDCKVCMNREDCEVQE